MKEGDFDPTMMNVNMYCTLLLLIMDSLLAQYCFA